MYKISFTPKEFAHLTDQQIKNFEELQNLYLSNRILSCTEFLKEKGIVATTSKSLTLHAKCNKLYVNKSKTKSHPYNILQKAFDLCGGDLRSQSVILAEYRARGYYSVWDYFKEFRGQTISLDEGIKLTEKITYFEIPFGKKRMYLKSHLDALK